MGDVARARLTRGGVARLLDCTISHVRRLEATSQLHPTIDPESRVRSFDRAEVEALRARLARRPRRRRNGPHRSKRDEVLALKERGELVAAVFRAFDDGLELPDVVIRAKAPPELVRELRREYDLSYEEGEAERKKREVAERTSRALASQRREQAERRRLDASIQRAKLLAAARGGDATELPELPELPDVVESSGRARQAPPKRGERRRAG